eukprot:CAMPEP_0185852082 /NCGR_PEP_ID=MMETSP1354-20130828/13159_1 /TAXON_ID=708628 /ORGANISM="Erythrolobus madagascarensis, Strain CCMP3276" /LENGTH=122 /DNA_ID=CAMNT_0028553237 /DNA_START=53 /DNA_END=418 /DNA_ORIENTATION=-
MRKVSCDGEGDGEEDLRWDVETCENTGRNRSVMERNVMVSLKNLETELKECMRNGVDVDDVIQKIPPHCRPFLDITNYTSHHHHHPLVHLSSSSPQSSTRSSSSPPSSSLQNASSASTTMGN